MSINIKERVADAANNTRNFFVDSDWNTRFFIVGSIVAITIWLFNIC